MIHKCQSPSPNILYKASCSCVVITLITYHLPRVINVITRPDIGAKRHQNRLLYSRAALPILSQFPLSENATSRLRLLLLTKHTSLECSFKHFRGEFKGNVTDGLNEFIVPNDSRVLFKIRIFISEINIYNCLQRLELIWCSRV